MSRCDKTESAEELILPGFRFHPTDDELVGFYLRRKIEGKPLAIDVITELDIYKFDPWELPKMAMGEKEWYFFCPRDRKYRNSARPNRVTGAGFWKATGTDRPIYTANGSECIGLKKSLVFYRGRAIKGVKTDWMMHEFRLPNIESASVYSNALGSHQLQDCWAICRIFKKNVAASQNLGASRISWIPELSEKVMVPTSTDKSDEIPFHEHTRANRKTEQFPPHLQVQCDQLESCVPADSMDTKHEKNLDAAWSNNFDRKFLASREAEEHDQPQVMVKFSEVAQREILTNLVSCGIMYPAVKDPFISNCPNSWENRNHQFQPRDDKGTICNGWSIKASPVSPTGNQKDVYDLLKAVMWDTPSD